MTHFNKSLFLLFAISSLTFAQSLSVGVKGGVPFTDAITDTNYSTLNPFSRSFSDSKDYIVGPMVELHIPFGFSVEADALYHPLNYATIATGTGDRFSTNVSSWEFPILAKYHFLPLPLVKPYIEAGPSFRTVGDRLGYLSKAGITAGAGVDFKLSRLRIGPEIRYTHWGNDGQFDPSKVIFQAPSNRNQAAFLLGISF